MFTSRLVSESNSAYIYTCIDAENVDAGGAKPRRPKVPETVITKNSLVDAAKGRQE
ncbi:MAG: hypothetical protein KJO55_06445 [Gammaproteobacteria bacterium]|nr:hypothetical protein [Gammaproteobacteria bacterium]